MVLSPQRNEQAASQALTTRTEHVWLRTGSGEGGIVSYTTDRLWSRRNAGALWEGTDPCSCC